MTDPCIQLHAYVDGELADAELAAFEVHLATCDACGDELPRLLAMMTALDGLRDAARDGAVDVAARGTARLTVLDGGAREAAAHEASAPAKRRPRRALWAAAALPLAAAAAVAIWLRPPAAPPQVATLAGELAPRRALEARLSYPGADVYRQRDVARGEQSHERISFERFGQLERAQDWHGLGVGSLLNGELARAGQLLTQAPTSPAVDSDRAALALVDGSPEAIERALEHADHALAAAPTSGAALWNHALALAAMNLPLAAARDFDHVVALHEPGWADEAHARAAALRSQTEQRVTRWRAANAARAQLLKDGTPVPAELLAITGYMTLTLYDAVRAAPSRARVEALLPMAEALDRAYRSDRLTTYVRRIATSDFRMREPLAALYGKLLNHEEVPDPAFRAFQAQLARGAADDIRLGLMVWTGEAASDLVTYRRLAEASGDPWFALIAEQKLAKAELARGAIAASEQRLRDAIARANREHLGYRALLLESDLELQYLQVRQLSQAHSEARQAHRDASAAGEVLIEMNALNDLAAINQDRYNHGLTRAYLAELLENTAHDATGASSFDEATECPTQLYAYQSLANTSLLQLDLDRARGEIARAPSCPGAADRDTLAVRTAAVRTELFRLSRREEDGRAARDALAAVKASAGLTPAQRALVAYIEGALSIDSDRAAGERLLRDAISQANRLTSDLGVQLKVRAYAFSLLALAAGWAGEHAKVLDVLAETMHIPRPERCAVAVAVQGTQSVVAFADAHGEVGGTYATLARTGDLDASTLIPSQIVSRLRSCEKIVVLARAPVLGAARLLPPDLAWSYLLKGTPAGPAVGDRLVIANPDLPPELKMPPLSPYPDEPGAPNVRVLRGAGATPTRVLAAMHDASIIEFHTHGFIANDVSEASYLMLAPDADRQYAMTADDVARVKLTAAPLVILGACHAAASSHSLEGGTGLAEAFLRSGARAVVASPDAIKDLGAHDMFTAVRERVIAGATPAAAVRDERVHRLALVPSEAWVSGVIVFE